MKKSSQRPHVRRSKKGTTFNAGKKCQSFETFLKHNKEFKIIYVPTNVLKDYAGMNYFAAIDMGFKAMKLEPYDILVDNSMSKEKQRATIVHEITEAKCMKQRMNYWQAHNLALQAEKCIK